MSNYKLIAMRGWTNSLKNSATKPMNKLTLPIQAGKKYIQRDGKMTTPTESSHGDLLLIDGITHIFSSTGKSNNIDYINYTHDLVADYIEQVAVTGHIHAASMLLYAQDAAETDKPWERWEFDDTQGRVPFIDLNGHPQWNDTSEYQRKPPAPVFININGYQVPEPMRVAPAIGTKYWTPRLQGSNTYASSWDAYTVDLDRLDNGLCHSTPEAAILHSEALLSFTKVKV